MFGAAHQWPQVLQVAVDDHLPDRDVERVRLRFAERRHLAPFSAPSAVKYGMSAGDHRL
jgi:hypothetical protein